MAIRDIIKIRRKLLGLTYEDIAKIVGVTKSTVRKWETGSIKNIGQDKMMQLAKSLQVPLVVLYDSCECALCSNTISKNFSINLKKLRLSKNITQSELSELIGVSKSAISMYENSQREPSFETLDLIATHFNVSLNNLLSSEDISILSANNISTSERLKSLRLKTEMTLEEVGRVIGVTKQSLYKYENGIVENIPIDKIEHLALLYNVSPAYIVGWEHTKNLDAQNSFVGESSSEYSLKAIAAHAIDDLTEEEQLELIDYAKYLKSKRKQ